MNNRSFVFSLRPTTTVITTIVMAAVVGMAPDEVLAQGCVAARGAGLSCAGNILHLGENLPPESGWQFNVGYCYLKSDRHFTGSHEEEHRQREGSEVINRLQFTDFTLSYAFNPRFSASFTVPFANRPLQRYRPHDPWPV